MYVVARVTGATKKSVTNICENQGGFSLRERGRVGRYVKIWEEEHKKNGSCEQIGFSWPKECITTNKV